MRITSCHHLVCVLACVVLGGCGSSNAYKTVKVNGTIRYDDGSQIPAQRIELRFLPTAPPKDNKSPKIGIAEVNVDEGTFDFVNTYEFGDGIVAGKHKVVAMAMGEGNVLVPAIPSEYHDANTTPLEVDTDQRPLELVVKKP